jgi:hypothetical protein
VIRSLRKGYTHVDLQYKHTCDTIGAERLEAEVKGGQAVFRLSLKPSGGNQREDEEAFHTRELLSVSVNDSLVLKNLRSFHSIHKSEYSNWSLEIFSQGKIVRFSAKPSVGSSGQLQFTVLRTANG